LGINDWQICSTPAHLVQQPHFITHQDRFLQGMHLVNLTLWVRVVGTHSSPGKKIQCHPHGLFAQAIRGEVVAKIEQ